VANVTLDDVKRWFGFAYRPDLTTMVIVGDISANDARSEVEKYVDRWSTNGPKPDFKYPGIALNKPSSVTIPSSTAQQAEVELAELLGIHQDNPEHFALQIADTILTDEAEASLLFHDLRVAKGYVYQVGSELDIGHVRSTYVFKFAADPKNVVKAADALLADVRRLQTEALSQNDLQRAKALTVSRAVLSQDSYAGLASNLLEDSLSVRRANVSAAAQTEEDWRVLLAVTPEQLRYAVANWVRVNDFARVVVAPVSASR